MFDFLKRKQSSNNSRNFSEEKPEIIVEKFEKAKVSLDKKIISLKKEKNIDLTHHICRVELYIDISLSMRNRFMLGKVQDAVTRIFPVAVLFDDDQVMPVSAFGNGVYPLADMTLQNYATYVEREILSKHRIDEGTEYAPFVRQAIERAKEDNPYPLFNVVVTDGDCHDKRQSDMAFRESAKYKGFFQCIGIGDDDFDYLNRLDNLGDRFADNTAFVPVDEIEKLSDDELYDKLLEQYPRWLQAINLI